MGSDSTNMTISLMIYVSRYKYSYMEEMVGAIEEARQVKK